MVQRPACRWVSAAGAVAAAGFLAGATVLTAGSVAGAANHHGAKHAKQETAAVRLEKSAKFGKILVSSSGRTLYVLTADSAGKSKCTGACASIWPPLLAKGKAVAGKGMEKKLLGTFDRGHGVKQVRYHGHPLYTYSGDTRSGQANGEGIVAFGGTWYVIDAAGNPVKSKGASTTGKSSGYGSGSSSGGKSSGGSSSGTGW